MAQKLKRHWEYSDKFKRKIGFIFCTDVYFIFLFILFHLCSWFFIIFWPRYNIEVWTLPQNCKIVSVLVLLYIFNSTRFAASWLPVCMHFCTPPVPLCISSVATNWQRCTAATLELLHLCGQPCIWWRSKPSRVQSRKRRKATLWCHHYFLCKKTSKLTPFWREISRATTFILFNFS